MAPTCCKCSLKTPRLHSVQNVHKVLPLCWQNTTVSLTKTTHTILAWYCMYITKASYLYDLRHEGQRANSCTAQTQS